MEHFLFILAFSIYLSGKEEAFGKGKQNQEA